MHLVVASILSLGESPSAFGTTLALLLIFVVAIGGLVIGLIWYIVGQVMIERNDNQLRRREYDAHQTVK